MTENLQVSVVDVGVLKPDPENSRQHSDKNIDAIARSLQRFGQRKPIVVWQGFVIAGNGTLEAAKKLGWEKIVVSMTPHNWTHEEARAFSIADNRASELATWDDFALSNQLIELDANGWELIDLGFDSISPSVLELEKPTPPVTNKLYVELTAEQHAIVMRAFKNVRDVLNLSSDAEALSSMAQAWLDSHV